MNEEELKRAREPFYTKSINGVGLGLAIVKEIIQAHGENIDVISTQGVGSEFIFTLPKATAL